jgi:hypothetical protein
MKMRIHFHGTGISPNGTRPVYLCRTELKMSTTLTTILLGVGLLGLAFAGIAVKIWLKKDGEFAGTCASNNPLVTAEGGGCGFCGAKPEEKCRRDEVSAA